MKYNYKYAFKNLRTEHSRTPLHLLHLANLDRNPPDIAHALIL